MVPGPNILKGKIGEPPKDNIIKNRNNWVSIHSYIWLVMKSNWIWGNAIWLRRGQKKSLIFKLANDSMSQFSGVATGEEVFLSGWSHDRKFSTSQINKNTWGENYVAYIFRSWNRILSGWTWTKISKSSNHWKCTTKNIWVRFNSG